MSATPDIRIAQDYSYAGDDYWKWWIWLDGPDAALDQVEKVVYKLHRTFPDPVRTISTRGNRFRLETAGWGTFRIFAKAHMKSGEIVPLEHDLILEYPDGEPASA